MKLLENITNLIWDWNGTLVDDTPLQVEAYNYCLRKYGLNEITAEKFRSDYQVPLTHSILGWGLKSQDLDEFSDIWHDYYFARDLEIELREGALAALDYFKERNVTQSILSSFPHEKLLKVIEHKGLGHYFKAVSGDPEHGGSAKILRAHKLIRDLDINPESSLTLGDADHDAIMAKELGIPCILFAGGQQCKTKLLATGEVVLEELSDLCNWKSAGYSSQAGLAVNA